MSPVEKSILLPCPPQAAFLLFTEEISSWWPPERRHGGDAQSTIVLTEGGRFYERTRAGAEVELGAVLAWERPHRLVLDWYPGTDAEHPTRVEITFVSEGGGTRVRVVHGSTPASEALFPTRAPRYDASWTVVLAALERAAGGS